MHLSGFLLVLVLLWCCARLYDKAERRQGFYSGESDLGAAISAEMREMVSAFSRLPDKVLDLYAQEKKELKKEVERRIGR